MNVTTILRLVQRRFGDSGQIFITETDVIDWINDAQFEIARETKCLSTLVSPAASALNTGYALPTALLKIERVTYDSRPIPYVDLEELDSRLLDVTVVDTPECYYILNEKIYLYPNASATDSKIVNIYYARIPASIVVNTDALTIPEQFHRDVVTFCLIRSHERNENFKAVETLTAEFQNNLSKRLEDTNLPDDTYLVIRDDPRDSLVAIDEFW